MRMINSICSPSSVGAAQPIFTCITKLLPLLVFLSSCSAQSNHIDKEHYRQRVKSMFYHAYNGYMNHAYPQDELRPLTCDGQNTWGSYSLSLIDALDTLVVIGNYTEFRQAVKLLQETLEFDQDINVSVFETNIRVVGGLLSAHLMSRKSGLNLEPGWPCNGPLLRMAEQVAKRLLPAFQSDTGMPYGTVNLRYGVPIGETPVTCTAGVGTFLVEFGALSRLTGNPIYEDTAVTAMEALWSRRSAIGLLGNHINVKTGEWTALDSGIGAGVDSYFEYLLKGGVMLGRANFLQHLRDHIEGIEQYIKSDDWYMWSNMKTGARSLPIFQSLEAFWPGLQSLMGDAEKGRQSILNYVKVWKQFGFTPEFYSIPKASVYQGREGYPLRPELVESTMYIYQATKDPAMLDIGVMVIEAIDAVAKTDCGYATVHDVRDHKLVNRMESFFLAETTKYLYLLFDEENFIHNSGTHGEMISTPKGQCVIETGGYVFNTEAHPIDMAALDCCHDPVREQIGDVLLQLDIENILNEDTNAKRFKRSQNSDTEKEEGSEKLNNEKVKGIELITCPVENLYTRLARYGETASIRS